MGIRITYILIILQFPIILYATKLDSLRSLLNNDKISDKSSIYCEIAKLVRKTSIDSSDYFLEKGLKIAKNNKNIYQQAKIFLSFGKNSKIRSKYNLALVNFKKSEILFSQLNDSIELAKIYNNQGLIYKVLKHHDSALVCFHKSLDIKYLIDKKNTGLTLSNIGSVYFDWKDYNTAIEYYLEALEVFTFQSKNDFHTAIVLNRLGNVYQKQKVINKATDYFNESLQIFRKLDHLDGQATVIINLGNIYYYDYQNYDSAEINYLKSLEIYKELNSPYDIAFVLNSLGYIYYKKKQNTKAEKYFTDAINISLKYGFKDQLYINYLALSELYEVTDKPTEALSYFKKYYQLKDSLFTVDGQDKLMSYKAKYESFKKDKIIETLKLKNNIYEVMIIQKDKYETIVIILSIIIISLIGIVARYLLLTKKVASN